MHILHVIGSLGPGGAEKLGYELARRQRANGHGVTVALLSEPNVGGNARIAAEREASLVSLGIPVIQVANRTRAMVAASRGLRALDLTEPVDVVHAHLVVGAVAAKLGLRTRPAIVWTLHSTSFGFPRELLSLTRPCVDRYVGCSESVSTSLQPFLARSIDTVTNGIELDSYQVAAVSRQNAGARDFRILTVGALRAEKNHARLVHAALEAEAVLSSNGIRLTLDIVGDGEMQVSLAELIAATGADRFTRLLGARSDIPHLMSQADCFAISSDREGLPLALIESMAAGLPSVVTPFEGSSQVTACGRTSLVAANFSSEALARCIVQLATNEQLRSNLSRESVAAAPAYSLDRCAAEYQRIYDEAADRHRAG